MRSTEKQELKRKITRLGLFLLIVFIPALIVCVLLMWARVKQWLNIMVLVILLFILYSLYVWVCGKLDKRKAERLKNKRDPFSE